VRKHLTVNGQAIEVDIDPGERLVTTLRESLALTGTKEACAAAECGACTVLIDGHPRFACSTLTATVTAEVSTIEGLQDHMVDLSDSFARLGGFQCGFCTSGQLVSAFAYLARTQSPEETEIRDAMAGNLCRCTGYHGIVRAIEEELTRRQCATAEELDSTGIEH
jgi:aerobic-type carbon monoxide dehydrogenase small subunit (CoxS/CutS family)